jgi:hypothetical protein
MIHIKCCRRLRDAINTDSFPLTYDDHVEEVQMLLSGRDGIAVVRYCPFCGERLDSGRAKRFTEPTDDDCEDVRQQLKGLASLDDVMTKLGEPNDQGTGCGPESRPWIQWARYSEIWNSLVLIVGEHEVGSISWAISLAGV